MNVASSGNARTAHESDYAMRTTLTAVVLPVLV